MLKNGSSMRFEGKKSVGRHAAVSVYDLLAVFGLVPFYYRISLARHPDFSLFKSSEMLLVV